MLGKILSILFEGSSGDKNSSSGRQTVSHEEFKAYRQDVKVHLESVKKELVHLQRMAAIAVLLVIVFGFVVWIRFQNMKETMFQRVDHEIELTKDRVRVRLDSEFRSENIRQSVREAAQEYTRAEAQSLIHEEVALVTKPILDQTNQRLVALSQLHSLEVQARADSRKAFEEINAMTRESDAEIRHSAQTVLTLLRKQYEVLRHRQGLATANITASNTDGKRYEYSELTPKDQVELLGDPNASFETIQKMRSQISRKAELEPHLLRLLKQTDSLAASVACTGILSERNKKSDLDIFDFPAWIAFLEKRD